VAKRLGERLSSGEEGKVFTVYSSKGCPKCHMTGYSQYVILFEMLIMADWLKESLLTEQPVHELEKTAIEHGFHSLKNKAEALLTSGQTSLEEVFSILM
jgi:general secretion pathway protein E